MTIEKQMTSDHHWGYENDQLDPSKWPDQFGGGKRQSPINIEFDARIIRSHAFVEIDNNENYNENGHNGNNTRQSTINESDTDYLGSRLRQKLTIDHQQAPISKLKDKQSRQTVHYKRTNHKIFLGYPRCLNNLRIINTGHGWQVNIPNEIGTHTLMCGPPFADRQYRLAQFHCHWGTDNEHGSEHTVNGRSYAAELHFVHWNCSQFESFEQAAQHRHGLAVLAVFVQALEDDKNRNKYLEKIITNVGDVCPAPGTSAAVRDHVDIKLLFPTDRWIYAAYEGSLTTPPLTECVDWCVFLSPIICSKAQIDKFRNIQCQGDGSKIQLLRRNCRPVQPLNDRTLTIWSRH